MLHLKNGRVFTMAEAGVIENCDVLIEDGRIVAVGRELESCGEVIDMTGMCILPGLVDAHSHIGGISMDGSFDSDFNEMTKPVTAEMNVYDAIDPMNEGFRSAAARGITTSCIAPGSANVIGGWVIAAKSAGKSFADRVIKNPAALKGAMGINPKGVYAPKFMAPMTRMSIAETMREYLRKVKEYAQKKAEAGEDSSKLPPYDAAMEHGLPVIEKQIPLKVHSYQHDMMTVLEIAKEFDILVTLDHAQGATDFIDELAASEHLKGVVYGPIAMGLFPGEGCKIDYDAIKLLSERGVCTAVMTDGPLTNASIMVRSVGEAVREGMDPLEALKTITVNAARIIGCEERIGTIEVGKDADIAVFSAQPALDPRAAVVMTIIDGEIVYKRAGR